ncbi:MAG TPA: hypothetical protein VKP30_19375 [Polyangiaceae bacterium]|nr:hypothetical protein [Polyangiaceae bacterium]
MIGLALMGCQQSSTSTQLRSLAGSGRVSLVCRDATSGEGRDVRACPSYQDSAVDVVEDRHMLALVTQTLRGEVAVVDLTDEKVLDEDPWVPGTEFLTVGDDPRAIVSTPGGIASFVAVAKPGLEAIFALPTTCITAPNAGKRTRDLTLWPACRLPGRPGEMTIVTDPTPGQSGYRSSCPRLESTTDETVQAWVRAAQSDNANGNPLCPANLALEEGIAPVGRRKLLVTLPDLGKIALYDAQAILNMGPGTFQDCIPDSVIALGNTVPNAPVTQPLPADLHTVDAAGKTVTQITYPAAPFVAAAGDPQPAGMALADGKLYVADLNVPLIHVVDVSDPCNVHEQYDRPLRPLSYDHPNEPVYTRDVSVSSVTVAGETKKQRFLYAVESSRQDARKNGSIGAAMVFDLSEGASTAPVVRPRSIEMSFEPADRILFESPIAKLQIVTHDAPVLDPATQTAQVGVLCDPYPSSQAVGTLYRTDEDFTEGAGPRKLRGIFGIMALGNGQLAAVDIEDWDAPCRRPAANNPATSGVDWLGCQRDPALVSGDFTVDGASGGTPTVTDESSCNVIEPHRFRSASYYRADSTLGVHAPSVSSFPRLSAKESGDLPTGVTDVERKYPLMLAVPFQDVVEDAGESVNAFLSVGSVRYELSEGERYRIDYDPAIADKNSLLLPLSEPRAWVSQEQFTAIFEGTVVAERGSGFLPEYDDGLVGLGFNEPIEPGSILLRDGDAQFCGRGVEDYRIALETARRLWPGLPADDLKLSQFASLHSDFVVLTGNFDSNDPYFKSASQAVPSQCSQVVVDGGGTELRSSCEALFGTYDEPVGRAREFVIREAQADDLLLVPLGEGEPALWATRVHCCFPPTAHRYEVRAGNQWVVGGNTFLHRMTGTSDSACRRDPDPRRAKLRGRAFEIASREKCDPKTPRCAIGPATDLDPCVLEHPDKGVVPSAFGVSVPAACLFDSLKARFAIYRGQQPSVRDMMFKWRVTGGFSTLSSLIGSSTSQITAAPVDMVYSESLGALVVVDGASGGLSLIGFQRFAPMRDPFL